jgi:universal stress protein E
MQMFRRILVGVDLSSGDRLAAAELPAPTREAVKRAIWLAGQLSAELTFMAVLEVSAHAEELLHDEFAEAARSAVDAARADLDKLIAEARLEEVEATAKVACGRAWEEIVKAVLRDKHDLVIVGTKDLSRASRFLFGSNATKLLRTCPCPVWVTRPDPDWDDLKILVATDLGEVGRRALKLAIDGAQLAGAKLHVLHAVEEEYGHRMWLTGLAKGKIDAIRDARRNEANETLQEQLAETDYRTLPFGVMVHVVEGEAETAILDAIEEYGIDLLIMGTAARSGITGLLIGNTAERILSQAPCSVLAIKPADFECPVTVDEG